MPSLAILLFLQPDDSSKLLLYLLRILLEQTLLKGISVLFFFLSIFQGLKSMVISLHLRVTMVLFVCGH